MAGIAMFGRGKTWYGATQTINTSDYGESARAEGQPMESPGKSYADRGVLAALVGSKMTKFVCARNVTGVTVYGKLGVTWASGYEFKRFDGYNNGTGERVGGVIDDALPSGGVRNGDLCWVATEGPHLVTSDAAGTDVAVGDALVSVTAATSTASTTAGKFAPATTTFTTTELGNGVMWNRLQNNIGIALSATTPANSDVLADLTIYKNN